MSIVDVKPMWSRNVSDASADAKLSAESRRRSDRLAWTVLVENASDYIANTLHEELAQNYGFVVGGLHPTDDWLRATTVRISRVAPLLFVIDSTFHAEGSEPGDSPLDDPPVVLPEFLGSREEVDEDFNGDPLVTVNGEPFDPPSEADIYDLVLKVRRNLPAFDYQLAWLYMGNGRSEPATNSDTFLGFPAGAGRVINILPEEVDTEDFTYWRVTASFQFRRAAPGSTVAKAWYKRIRHEGFKVKVDGEIVEKRDAARPVLLKADGTEADLDGGDEAHWLEFQMGPSLPFAALGLI